LYKIFRYWEKYGAKARETFGETRFDGSFCLQLLAEEDLLSLKEV